MEKNERTGRIERFEDSLNRAVQAADRLEAALTGWDAVQAEIRALETYYTGPDWKADFAADAEGLLPPGLRRGVLSEDAVWNLLERVRELRSRMGAAARSDEGEG